MRPSKITGLALAAFISCCVPALARAAPSDAPSDEAESQAQLAATAARNGMALPNTIAATADPKQRAIAVGLGGYDAALKSDIARFAGDVNLFGPLDLRIGLAYLSDIGGGQPQFQPEFGLRVRILSQARDGIDFAAAILYHRERYTPDDGMVQALLAVGRHWGRFGVLGNVAYGQDGEGDDRDGDLSLAVMYELAQPCQIALESHLRFDIASSDPRRRLRGEGPFDLQAGPLLHYSLGPAILTAQAGISASRLEYTRTGVFAMGGLGGVY